MIRQFKRFWRDEKGATAVEFAMVSVLMLTMLFGTIELGRIFWTYNAVQSATELTARYFITHTSTADADLQTYAQTAMNNMQLDGSKLTITVTKSTTSSIKFIQLDSSYAYSPLGTLITQFNNLTLTSRTRISYP